MSANQVAALQNTKQPRNISYSKDRMGSLDHLVILAQKQDVDSYAKLYEIMHKDLYRFAYYILKNHQDAEDVVSETVIAGFESIHNLRNITSFRPWMFKILGNRCKCQIKKYINCPQPFEESFLYEFPDIEQNCDLKDAFEMLDVLDRIIISLLVFEGYNSKETADLLHMNSNTVRSRLRRSLEKMRNCLDSSS